MSWQSERSSVPWMALFLSPLPWTTDSGPVLEKGRVTLLSESKSSRKEPMQLGIALITPAEHSRRLCMGSCLYCGKQVVAWLPVPFSQMGPLVSNTRVASEPYFDPCTGSVPFPAQGNPLLEASVHFSVYPCRLRR